MSLCISNHHQTANKQKKKSGDHYLRQPDLPSTSVQSQRFFRSSGEHAREVVCGSLVVETRTTTASSTPAPVTGITAEGLSPAITSSPRRTTHARGTDFRKGQPKNNDGGGEGGARRRPGSPPSLAMNEHSPQQGFM